MNSNHAPGIWTARSIAIAAITLLAAASVAAADTPSNCIDSQQAHAAASTGREACRPQAMQRFIGRLLRQMTLREKTGQLNLLSGGQDKTGRTLTERFREEIAAGNVGAMFNTYSVANTRELQQIAVTATRLKIPLLFGYDVVHGHRTIFPISLGEAASWDLAAIENAARIAATEAAAEGLHWTFAPMADIARDARWGRISEGAGEDVYLTAKITEARVRGFQGKDLAAVDTILATVKHYAAYGAAQAGRDYHTTDMSERELRDTYLPPFKAAVDAGVATVMTAFNDLNGVPATANRMLLDDVLRKQWGFSGFVVTDYTSINELVPHGFAADEAQAGELAINAGVDMDMQGTVFLNHLAASVAAKRVRAARIDAAVRRILEMKYRLGLFTDPYRYSDPAREATVIYRRSHLEAARDLARKSMVLLKNTAAVLPLKDSIRSIAVVGPLGDSKEDMIGSWSAAGDRKTRPVSLLQGLRARAGKDVRIEYARGAGYEFDSTVEAVEFEKALDIARHADIVIAAMGEKWDMTGEAASRTSLNLPGSQTALLKELHKLGKPIVLVLMSGRPLSVSWAADNVDAILEAWYPGTMGGHAVADVLFGDYNPSGKLPVTFPRTVGQVPIFYNMKNTGRPYTAENLGEKFYSRYLDLPNEPLYPFGHGLSYTTFAYSPIELSSEQIRMSETLTATVTVSNTGERDGEEIVQLYIRDLVGSVTRPVKELKAFKKIHLKAADSQQVSFRLGAPDLAFHRADMSYGAEPGDFLLFIGTSSADVQQARFTVVP